MCYVSKGPKQQIDGLPKLETDESLMQELFAEAMEQERIVKPSGTSNSESLVPVKGQSKGAICRGQRQTMGEGTHDHVAGSGEMNTLSSLSSWNWISH